VHPPAFRALAVALSATFKSRALLQLENLALRHQLGVLQRSVKRPKLTAADCFFWARLSSLWADWRKALIIVKPETVIAWHRNGFRLFWTWRIQHGKPGRPVVPKEVRQLPRQLCLANPLWGAPRVHGELLKLGIDIGETSVGKYMVRRLKPLSFFASVSPIAVTPGSGGNPWRSPSTARARRRNRTRRWRSTRHRAAGHPRRRRGHPRLPGRRRRHRRRWPRPAT
jgi:hypothetical protein